jgi:hypothetical protein
VLLKETELFGKRLTNFCATMDGAVKVLKESSGGSLADKKAKLLTRVREHLWGKNGRTNFVDKQQLAHCYVVTASTGLTLCTFLPQCSSPLFQLLKT